MGLAQLSHIRYIKWWFLGTFKLPACIDTNSHLSHCPRSDRYLRTIWSEFLWIFFPFLSPLSSLSSVSNMTKWINNGEKIHTCDYWLQAWVRVRLEKIPQDISALTWTLYTSTPVLTYQIFSVRINKWIILSLQGFSKTSQDSLAFGRNRNTNSKKVLSVYF